MCHSVLVSPETSGSIFQIPTRFECALLLSDVMLLELHKYFKFLFSRCMLQMWMCHSGSCKQLPSVVSTVVHFEAQVYMHFVQARNGKQGSGDNGKTLG